MALAKLLNEYGDVRASRMAGATKRKQAEAKLLISGLQQRLLSSIEAFARTLRVHRRTMEKIWATEAAQAESTKSTADPQLVLGSLDADDDRSQLSEAEQQALEQAAIEAATEESAGDSTKANISREKELLAQMERIAESARGLPDARVCRLIGWLQEHMCPGVRQLGQPSPQPDAPWADTRLLIFTEYEDTKRYIMEMLRAAISETSHGRVPA